MTALHGLVQNDYDYEVVWHAFNNDSLVVFDYSPVPPETFLTDARLLLILQSGACMCR